MSFKSYVAELVGTFGLVLIGAGAILAAQGGLVGVAFAHGIILMAMVYSFATVSGSHFNPAVTIVMVVHKRIAAMQGFAYIFSQLVGAVLAAYLLQYLFPGATPEQLYGFPASIPLAWGIVVEAVLTFFLVNTIYGTAVNKKAPVGVFGFAIGLTVAADILMGGSLTGAAMNPARAFGPGFVSGVLGPQLIYWVGPIIGALAASSLHEYLFLDKKGK